MAKISDKLLLKNLQPSGRQSSETVSDTQTQSGNSSMRQLARKPWRNQQPTTLAAA